MWLTIMKVLQIETVYMSLRMHYYGQKYMWCDSLLPMKCVNSLFTETIVFYNTDLWVTNQNITFQNFASYVALMHSHNISFWFSQLPILIQVSICCIKLKIVLKSVLRFVSECNMWNNAWQILYVWKRLIH